MELVPRLRVRERDLKLGISAVGVPRDGETFFVRRDGFFTLSASGSTEFDLYCRSSNDTLPTRQLSTSCENLRFGPPDGTRRFQLDRCDDSIPTHSERVRNRVGVRPKREDQRN